MDNPPRSTLLPLLELLDTLQSHSFGFFQSLLTLQLDSESPLQSFDLVFNPVSTIFVPDVETVWREARRVLRPGGRLLTGVMNPAFYLFDHEAIEAGADPAVKYDLPYEDTRHLTEAELSRRLADHEPLEFSHSLDTLIGGLLRAGFVLKDFYEDGWSDEATPLNKYMKVSFAMLAEAV